MVKVSKKNIAALRSDFLQRRKRRRQPHSWTPRIQELDELCLTFELSLRVDRDHTDDMITLPGCSTVGDIIYQLENNINEEKEKAMPLAQYFPINCRPFDEDISAVLMELDPDIEPGNPDIEHGNPDIEHGNPDIEHGNPNIEHGNPNIEPGNPNIEHGNPDIEPGNPDIVRGNPNFMHGNPDIEHGNPDIVRGNPDIEHGNPDIERGNPNIEHGNPNIEHGNPDIVRGNPNIVRGNPNFMHGNPIFEGVNEVVDVAGNVYGVDDPRIAGTTMLMVSAAACWANEGLPTMAVVMGTLTQKVVALGVQGSFCLMCAVAVSHRRPVTPPHFCFFDHDNFRGPPNIPMLWQAILNHYVICF